MEEKWQPMQYSHDTSNYWREAITGMFIVHTPFGCIANAERILYSSCHDYELGPKPFSDRDDLNCVSYNKWKLTEYNDIILFFLFDRMGHFSISHFLLHIGCAVICTVCTVYTHLHVVSENA